LYWRTVIVTLFVVKNRKYCNTINILGDNNKVSVSLSGTNTGNVQVYTKSLHINDENILNGCNNPDTKRYCVN